MAKYQSEYTGAQVENLLNAINAELETPGSSESPMLIGFKYMGKATPATIPLATPTKIYYLADQVGIYQGFNNIHVEVGEVVNLCWNGSEWSKEFVTSGSGGIGNGTVTPEKLSESTLQLIETGGGGTITNLADDEDLTTENLGQGVSVLKFANKKAGAINGLGRVYLRKNLVGGVNILDQNMFIDQDSEQIPKPYLDETRFIVQYAYSLPSAAIQLPLNSVLDFQDGSFSDGTIVGNNSWIITNGKTLKDLLINITLQGNFMNCGATSARPTLTSGDKGFEYYDTTLDETITWNGSTWISSDGYPADWRRTGTTAQRPSISSGTWKGYKYFDTDLSETITWNGTIWIAGNGYNANLRTSGTTAQRPTPAATDKGFVYYDTDLGYKITWDGTQWTNPDGTLTSNVTAI